MRNSQRITDYARYLAIGMLALVRCNPDQPETSGQVVRRPLVEVAEQREQFELAPGAQDLLTSLYESGWHHIRWDQAVNLSLSPRNSLQQAIEVPLDDEFANRIHVGLDLQSKAFFIRGNPGNVGVDPSTNTSNLISTGSTEACPPPPRVCVTCEPKLCDYETSVGWHWWCIDLVDNLVGSAVERRWRRGYTDCAGSGGTGPNWYANRCGGVANCPGHEDSTGTYTQCQPNILCH